MLSIQETVQKDEVKEQLRLIKREMEATGKFHPDKCSILNVQSESLRAHLAETLRTIPLSEFLAKSGTTGLSGAAYLVPDKLHSDLVGYSQATDIVPLISADVVSEWKGADSLLVNVTERASMVPRKFSSGGSMAHDEANTMQITLTPVSFGLPFNMANDLLEDEKYGLVQWHLKQAAVAMGEYSSNLALTVLQAGADGWGTLNSAATGDADETRFTTGTTSDVLTAIRKLGDDRWDANTMVCTHEAWCHSIAAQASAIGWNNLPPTLGYHTKLGDIDVVKSSSTTLHASTDTVGAAMTNCVTIIFDRLNAMLTGRKRWLQINNYSDPVDDIAGATVTARQDSVTLYDDAIYTLTET